MTTSVHQPAIVEFYPDSTINEFVCGDYAGHVTREDRQPKRWNGNTNTMEAARPERWQVSLYHRHDSNGAWRQVCIPVSRTDSMERAVVLAINAVPLEVIELRQGTFGGCGTLKRNTVVWEW